MRITVCQYRFWVGLLQPSQHRGQSVWYFSAESTDFLEALGFVQYIAVIYLYFLCENYPIFCKLYINEDHLYQILFPLFQNTYSAFIQLLPVLVIVIISVITQLLAANPPYSLFYKS